MTENENIWTVYAHINKINRKAYVGITGRDPKKRWGHNGYNYKKSTYFYNAIQKYGWDNFEHIILMTNLSKEMANEVEKALIKKYELNNRSIGYNIAKGGNVSCMSELAKEKISKSNKGKTPWIKGKHHTDETKRKISESNLKTPRIIQYNRYTGEFIGIYNNSIEAESKTKVPRDEIYAICNKRAKSIKGYIFRYESAVYIPYQSLPHKDMENSKNTHMQPICQYDLEGNFIREYPSIKDAENYLGKEQGKTLIWHCANQKKPSALGYLWAYKGKDPIPYKTKKTKKVNQYDLSYNFIQTFSSVKEASSSINGCDKTLIKHLKSKTITPYKNYIWKYA